MVVFFGIGFKRFTVPAWMFLFYWGGLQLFSLLLYTPAESSVAYAVHIGGFGTGLISAMIWKVSYPYAEEHLNAFVSEQSH